MFFEVITGVLGRSGNFNITQRFLLRRRVFPDYLFLMTMVTFVEIFKLRRYSWIESL